jgi:uncharacterized UBP type Zn finger protein
VGAGAVSNSRRPMAQRLINTGNSCFLNSVVQVCDTLPRF